MKKVIVITAVIYVMRRKFFTTKQVFKCKLHLRINILFVKDF